MASALETVDWSKIPAPEDDGAAAHLTGMALPSVTLSATNGTLVDLSGLSGRHVIYIYPMTGRPDQPLPEGWDGIPGARGCTPQSCAFRDHADELSELGVTGIYGLSTQDSDYQREAKERLHLPFELLSDDDLCLADALDLPRMDVAGKTLLKRMALVVDDALIRQVFYPVFPPDRNAADVIAWLRAEA